MSLNGSDDDSSYETQSQLESDTDMESMTSYAESDEEASSDDESQSGFVESDDDAFMEEENERGSALGYVLDINAQDHREEMVDNEQLLNILCNIEGHLPPFQIHRYQQRLTVTRNTRVSYRRGLPRASYLVSVLSQAFAIGASWECLLHLMRIFPRAIFNNRFRMETSRPFMNRERHSENMSPLHILCYGNRVNLLEILVHLCENFLSYGALRDQDSNGLMPLHYLCENCGRADINDIVGHVLAQDPGLLYEEDNRRRTPLHMACIATTPITGFDLVVFLMEWATARGRQDIFLQRDLYGDTPISLLARGNPNLPETLLNRNVS